MLVAGVIVSARTFAGTDKQPEHDQLNLMLDSGEFRTVDLGAATGLRFPDPKLQQQFKDYLAMVATARSKDKRAVYIDASGANVENVYQTGLSWQNPTLLFSVQSVGGARAEYLGIAYDSRNNSLWVSGWADAAVNDYSLSGALLSSFTGPGSLSALAYDSADNTLWGSYDETNSLYQYSLAGVLLQSGTPAGLVEGDYIGGDMSKGSGSGVPEPATTVLVVAGLAVLVARRRRLV